MLSTLRDLLFPLPVVCLWCAAAGGPICAVCLAALTGEPMPTCARCGRRLPERETGAAGRCCHACRVRPPAYARITSLGPYAGLLRWSIAAVKSHREIYLLEPLAQLLWRQVQHNLTDFAAVAFIPAHRRRLAARGFNPSEVLAAKLAAIAGRPLLVPGLVRRHPTDPQTGLRRGRRWCNQRGAFTVHPRFSLRRRGPLGRVLLVDDVLTTGSTLDAAARALLAAGVEAVMVAVLAETSSAPKPLPPVTR